MKEAVISMFSSKKFLVFISTTITAVAVAFGLPEEQAAQLVDKLVNLAMAYMGGQGVADAGKYFGVALRKDAAAGRVAAPPASKPAVVDIPVAASDSLERPISSGMIADKPSDEDEQARESMGPEA